MTKVEVDDITHVRKTGIGLIRILDALVLLPLKQGKNVLSKFETGRL